MSTLKVSEIQNAATTAGGISIDSSGVVSGALPYPNRNLLYNGAMQVAQRGTSTAGITDAGYYTADRWYFNESGSTGTWTNDIQADAPTGSGLRNSFRVVQQSANTSLDASDFLAIDQRLEGQDLQRIAKGTASAQQVTLSFWVKSNVTGTYIAELADQDNTRQVSAAYTISASATWEKKTITFPADTTGAFNNDNALSLVVRFALAMGSDYTSGTLQTTWASTVNANRYVGQTNLSATLNNYWQITGVQLETGDVATDFEFKSYGQELAECQRYYYRHADGNNKTIGTAMYPNGAQARAGIQFPVTMRTPPSLEATSGTNYYALSFNGSTDSFNSLTIVQPTETMCGVYNNTEISGVSGYAGWMYTSNASVSVSFSAEL